MRYAEMPSRSAWARHIPPRRCLNEINYCTFHFYYALPELLREGWEACDRMGAVSFAEVVCTYRLSGRSTCFAEARMRPERSGALEQPDPELSAQH